MPDIREHAGLPRYDPGGFTTPGSYSVNPTGDEGFAGALAGMSGLGSLIGPMAMGAVKGPGITRTAQMRWLEALKQMPLRIRDMILTRPEMTTIRPSMEPDYGIFRYPTHEPRTAPTEILYNPLNKQREIIQTLLHEPGHWAQHVGTPGGVDVKLPGTELTPKGTLTSLQMGKAYRTPARQDAEILPLLLEQYGAGGDLKHVMAQASTPELTLQALEQMHPGSAAHLYKVMMFQNQVQRGDIHRTFQGMGP